MRRPLLAAKFLVPSLRLGVVPRSRLYERLTAAESARVTIVVARPAGARPLGWLVPATEEPTS
jgi:ATP/maltotriose-dependent transcriptional regulator MalT